LRYLYGISYVRVTATRDSNRQTATDKLQQQKAKEKAKQPYILAKELYFLAKELCFLVKEPYILPVSHSMPTRYKKRNIF